MKLYYKRNQTVLAIILFLGVLLSGGNVLILLWPALLSSSPLDEMLRIFILLVWNLGCTATILCLVHRALVKPMSNLSKTIRAISATSNLSLRVPDTYNGELREIVDAVNNILLTTESAYLDMLKARYEVESANKGKSLFIAKVSHELRTPIHGITGMLRILLKHETTPGKRQYIQMAQDAAISLLETINEILDFSKMQNGELTLEHQEFDLPETLRSIIGHLVPRFEEKPNVTLCWDINPEVPETATGDATRIRNILLNLLGNAFKFTETGYVKLEVSFTQQEHKHSGLLRFAVSDSGIGISTDKLSTIFDPFTTADEGNARLYAGTGLGLAIVKQITERMGGTISVSSTLGTGSTFVVELPLMGPSAPPYQPHSTNDLRHIAILSSSEIHNSTVTAGLRQFGFTTNIFSFNDPDYVERITSSTTSYHLIHIIKDKEVLNDELAPILRHAEQHNIPVILSLSAADISTTDQLGRSENFSVTLQPTCALDLLMISSGDLVPKITLVEESEAASQSKHKLNILIADDAKTNRIILRTLLEDAGHTVEVVENGQQLLDRISCTSHRRNIQPHKFDLVLTDIQMPVMDGLTAALHFRELERQSNTERKLPIIAVTSYAFPEECTKMLASGIDHIITKPINPKRLNQIIAQISDDSGNYSDPSQDEAGNKDIIEELCQLTENITLRLGDLTSELSDSLGESLPSVNIQGVFERSGESLRRTGLIISGFIESYEELVATLENAPLPIQDPIAFRRTIHSLKGLLLDAGADLAAHKAATLEEKVVYNPSSITCDDLSMLIQATTESASILKEVVVALPSLELYSALPSLEDGLTVH